MWWQWIPYIGLFWFLIGLLTASTNARSVADVLYNWRVWLCESRPIVWVYLLRRLLRGYYMFVSLFCRLLGYYRASPWRHDYNISTDYMWFFELQAIHVSHHTACALWPICMLMRSSYLVPTFPLPNLPLPSLPLPTLPLPSLPRITGSVCHHFCRLTVSCHQKG